MEEYEKFEQLCNEDRELKNILGTSDLDFANERHIELYAMHNLPHIIDSYHEYEETRKRIQSEEKFTAEYKKSLISKLRNEFLREKHNELAKSRERVSKVIKLMKTKEDAENKKKDPVLLEMQKMNLMLMMNTGLEFTDRSFLESLIPEIIKFDEVAAILKAKVKGTEKEIINVKLKEAIAMKNSKYDYLHKLDNQLATLQNQADLMFTSADPKKSKWIKVL